MTHPLPIALAAAALLAGGASSAVAANTQVVTVTLDTAAIVAEAIRITSRQEYQR